MFNLSTITCKTIASLFTHKSIRISRMAFAKNRNLFLLHFPNTVLSDETNRFFFVKYEHSIYVYCVLILTFKMLSNPHTHKYIYITIILPDVCMGVKLGG